MNSMKSVRDVLLMISTSAFCVLMVLFLTSMNGLPVEASVSAEETITTIDYAADENHPSEKKHPSEESAADFEKVKENWSTHFSGEGVSQPHHQEDVFQRQELSRLRLKSPGKLPGIELGVELNSLQAFQSVVPSEGLSKGLDLKQDQPLLLPPSINAPDYNGGFLRFTW